ncbi:MAG TPA: DUF1189 family protein [Candidatus Eisenbacteria bacterium]|nr:DUF1189 family protein [Candidatus Eisenbacteria bacterium]
MGAAVWVLLAPVLALFEPGFYARAARASVVRGFAYLAYLAFLTAVGAGLMLEWRWYPALDDLAEWVADRLPAITFTVDGPRVADATPVVIEHPTYGRLLRIDTTADLPDTSEPALVTITRSQIVLSRIDGTTPEHRAWDVVPQTDEARRNWSDVTIDGRRARILFRELRWLAWMVVPAVFVLAFTWKLIAGLVYSVLAVVMNAVLGTRLSYPALLNVTCFALTPATLLWWMSVVGLLGDMRVEWPVSLWVTGTYLFLGIRSAGPVEPSAAVS